MELTLKEGKKVLSFYRLGKLISLERLTSGYTNLNYKAQTSKGVYVIRFFRDTNLEGILFEMALLEKLKKEKFPAAFPIRGRDQQLIRCRPLGLVTVYQFIEGEEPKPGKKVVRAIAQAMARLHLIKGWKKLKRPNPYAWKYSQSLIPKIKKAKYPHPALFEFVREQVLSFKEPLQKKVPKGFIHGDLFTDNTLFRDKKLQAFLDFECSCTGNLLADIGMTINGFCFKDNKLDQKLYRALMKEYQKFRPLTALEDELLPIYIRWGAFVWACWHLEQALMQKAPKNIKRAHYLMERIRELS